MNEQENSEREDLEKITKRKTCSDIFRKGQKEILFPFHKKRPTVYLPFWSSLAKGRGWVDKVVHTMRARRKAKMSFSENNEFPRG
jgi:hypothetical protein